ncbi:MAG: EamA family transporter [bacterium]|nr:EamA family transporter [bacterium]
MSFLPIAVIAYGFNAGAIIIDKILLQKALKHPLSYTFFINVLQLLVLFLVPFGFKLEINRFFYLAVLSGLTWVLATYTMFVALKKNEVSAVGAVVGTFNPLFALILGSLFLGQLLSPNQYLAFSILLLGTAVFTINLWLGKLKFNSQLLGMILSGFVFGLSYVLLREAFLGTNFITGLIIRGVSAGVLALSLLIVPQFRKLILTSSEGSRGITSKVTLILMGTGQTMGAASGLMIAYGVSLASPALVNSLFGVQYLVILVVSLILLKKHPHLLGENLTKDAILQKISGAGIISLGLYLLAR